MPREYLKEPLHKIDVKHYFHTCDRDDDRADPRDHRRPEWLANIASAASAANTGSAASAANTGSAANTVATVTAARS
jgi:hypothetical protein